MYINKSIKKYIPTLAVPLLIIALAGCETSDLYSNYHSTQTVATVKQGIVLKDSNSEEISLLKVYSDKIKKKPLFSPVKGESVDSFYLNNNNTSAKQVFFTTYPLDDREIKITPSLVNIDCSTYEKSIYELGVLFSSAKFSSNNQYMVMYHNSSVSSSKAGLYNPNEIAVIDVTAPPSDDNPRIFTADLNGKKVEDIIFLEPVTVGGLELELVAFIAEGLVQLVDFNNDTFASITLNLKTEQDYRNVTLNKMETSNAYKSYGPRIFATARNTTEIFDIELTQNSSSDAGFSASINLFGDGTVANNFHLVKNQDDMLLVSTNDDYKSIGIFAVATSAASSISVSNTLSSITSRQNEEELVLYGPNSSKIYFLETDNLAKEKGNNLTYLNIPSTISSVLMLDEDNMLIYPQNMSDGLIIVDLKTRSITNLSSSSINNWTISTLYEDTFYIGVNSTVSFFNMNTGEARDLILDAPIKQFQIFEKQGVGVVFHNSGTGTATMFPLNDPTRERSFILDGFLVEDMLENEADK